LGRNVISGFGAIVYPGTNTNVTRWTSVARTSYASILAT
jgi:hypothetical protein